MHLRSNEATLPTLALIAAVVLWGSSFIAMKVAVGAFHPMLVVFSRMAIAALAFAVFLRRFRADYRPGDWKWIVLMALCEPCLYFVCEAYALRYTAASQAGMITAILPLLTAVGARIFLQERTSLRTYCGFLLSIAGVVWLTGVAATTENAPDPLLGNFLEFLAMCCATGYMLLLKKLTTRYNSWFLTFMQALVGAVFFVPAMAVTGVSLPAALPLLPALCVVYLGLFISIGAYGFYNFGMSRLPAGQATAFVNLIPVVTLILGSLLLGDRFSTQQYLASLLVFLGVFLSQSRPRKGRQGLAPSA
ncbi:protein of unknown function DUF6 transmembrane [Desulfovibrio sp. X2]|uniref:DMT family transporter n=1 Tax=Desulfovibrio sp. X2 TaxID=941449 RepID=UPI000358B624|nr:DMT family transporter [Desulfovibrio sp. X2]EPR41424.1 protein of unknown function DUF6 transmembrane [Desulfovibrio sp. X2]